MKLIKTLKRAAAVMLAAVLSFGVTGCSEEENKETTTEAIIVTTEELLNRCSEEFQKADQLSLEAGYHMDTTATMQNLEIPFIMQMDTKLQIDSEGTVFVEGTSRVEYEEQKQEQVSKQYSRVNGKKLENYLYTDGNWNFSIDEYKESESQLNKQKEIVAGLKQYTAKMQVETIEEVEGKSCYKVSGNVSSEFLNEAMGSAGADSGELAQFTDSLEGKEIPISFWIQKESAVPVKLVLDLTAVMESAMNEATKDQGITYAMKNMDVSFTYKEFQVEQIVIPEEALVAAE